MNRHSRILFLTAPIGSGHTRAAQAVSAVIKKLDPQAETKVANVFDLFYPWIGQTILKVYLRILAWFPSLYGSMYGWGNNSVLAIKGREIISSFLARRMHKYIRSYQPDAIVCTHATPAGLVAYLARKKAIKLPSFAIVTDFVVHRLWVYPEIDYYYVAHSTLRDYLADHGIDYERTCATGIPIAANFNNNINKCEIQHQLNLLPHLKTILIMGGGAGVLPMKEIIDICEQIEIPLQIIIVTGNNERLLKKVEALALTSRHLLRPLGFVSNVDELMSIADVLISKPGGMTSAEALVKTIPMIIYKPIPGQEEANTRYLVSEGAAIQVNSPSELKEQVQLLMNNTSEANQMTQKIRLIARPAAAHDIARQILDHVNKLDHKFHSSYN